MGVINMLEIYRDIDNLTEDEMKEIFKPYDIKTNHNWTFDNLTGSLREHQVYIDYIVTRDNDKAEKFIAKIINAFQIKDIDIGEFVNYIKIYAKMETVRVSEWKFSTLPLTSDGKGDKFLTCCEAVFTKVNKWGDECTPTNEVIIHDENRQVVWFGNIFKDPSHHISFDNNYYAIRLDHKDLTIYKNIDIDITVNSNYDNLDEIINEQGRKYQRRKLKEIDLSDHFYVGFFHRSLLYAKKWSEIHYSEGINFIRNVTIDNGLVKIEIENISYPHKGYALLDLKDLKIIKAEKYGE